MLSFYGSKDPTNSVKSLKEDRVYQVHPTALTIIRHICSMKKKQNTNTNKPKHGEMDPVRKKPIQRTVTTAHLSVLMTVHSFSTQYTPFLPPDNHHSSHVVYCRRGADLGKNFYF